MTSSKSAPQGQLLQLKTNKQVQVFKQYSIHSVQQTIQKFWTPPQRKPNQTKTTYFCNKRKPKIALTHQKQSGAEAVAAAHTPTRGPCGLGPLSRIPLLPARPGCSSPAEHRASPLRVPVSGAVSITRGAGRPAGTHGALCRLPTVGLPQVPQVPQVTGP